MQTRSWIPDPKALAPIKATLRAVIAEIRLGEHDIIRENQLLPFHEHEHDEHITSLSLISDRPLDAKAFLPWIQEITQTFGSDILRMKGILAFDGDPDRFVVQGVHMLLDGDHQRPWHADEERRSRLVFIGKNLPIHRLKSGFETCKALADA